MDFDPKDAAYSKINAPNTLTARSVGLMEGASKKSACDLTDEEVFALAYLNGAACVVKHDLAGKGWSRFVTKHPIVIADDMAEACGFRVIIQDPDVTEQTEQTEQPPQP